LNRLVHVTTVPQTLGFLTGQADFLREEGLETFAISSPGEELDRFCERENVRGFAIEMARQITPWRDLIAVWRISKILRRLKPQIVHAHTPKAGLLAMIAARTCGVPVRIFHVHGLPHSTATGVRRRLLKWSTKIACALATRVLCVSFSIRDAAIAESLVPAGKIAVPANGSINGIDALGVFNPDSLAGGTRERVRARLGIAPESRVIGFVGRAVNDKGLRELAQAWRRIREEFPDLHWIIVGAEEPHDPLPAEAADVLRNDSRVHVTGWRHDLPQFYSAMDVMVLPSYREGFPVTPLEAAAMRVPVAATRIAGCVEAIEDGHTGTLIPPRDPAEIARAVRAYLADPELRRAHGNAARNRVLEKYRPIEIWRALASEYSRLLKRRNRGSAMKRLIDATAASAALVLFSPLLAAIAIGIRISMGPPVFFRQRRPGLHEKPFEILKFRTMADGDLPDALRLTAFGKFLRELSLDELPQLWNVLKGEMSLVGPRPLLMEYLSRYNDFQRRRHEVKPGITGWAQVHGRNEVPWQTRFEMDVWYVDHQSLSLDLKILWRTLEHILRRRGISEPGQTTMSPFGG
jgi:lipopolysaccharide/colanic/teichoic acid biosynthesis glycosyltransferase